MKKLLFLFIIALMSINYSFAQESDTAYQANDSIVAAQFPGGEIELFQFINKNTNYPTVAKNSNITGIVYISFDIEVDGSLTSIKLAEGATHIIGGCTEESIRVVKLMPNWEPQYRNGVAERSNFVIPIEFRLEGVDNSSYEKTTKKKRRN